MRLSKQLFSSEIKKPEGHQNKKTSSLLEDGTFSFYKDPGVPFYLPIGKKILDNAQSIFSDESEKLGMLQIEIPSIMKDNVLEKGQKIEDTFNEKTISLLNENLKGYHLITTPEPMLLDLASVSLFSHNQLPIRFVYDVDVVRGIKKPKGILKGRQFKTFMGNSFDKDKNSLEESLETFGQLSDNIFERLGIETYKRRNKGGSYIEHFYFCSEGENLPMPEIDPEERVRAMSLSMTYNYKPGKNLRANFRDKNNKNSDALYGTFGLGTQRVFYALFDSHRDERGFNLPLELSPFKYSVIPLKKKDNKIANEIYSQIKDNACLDDRKNKLLGERASFSDYIGIPWKIIVGNGEYTLKNREESLEKRFNDKKCLLNYLSKDFSF